MKTRIKRLLSICLALVFAVCLLTALPLTAQAESASDLAMVISRFQHGGTGELDAMAVGNVVTVTGSVTDATKTLYLDISSGVKVVWTASYSALSIANSVIGTNLPSFTGPLIELVGEGTFEIASGSIISKGSSNAINVNSSNLTVIVSGGTVSASAAGYAHTIRLSGYNDTVIVSGGTVEASGNGVAISAATSANSCNITISGGAVTSSIGHAILTEGYAFITVSGGMVSSEIGSAVAVRGQRTNITVNGGTLMTAREGATINADCGSTTIEVKNGGVVKNTGTDPAILVENESNSVVVNGGMVSASRGAAIVSSGREASIVVNAGDVSSEHNDAIRSTGNTNSTVTVNGGTVSGGTLSDGSFNNPGILPGTYGRAIYSEAEGYLVTINGGTVSADNSTAVFLEKGGFEMNGGLVKTTKDFPAIYLRSGFGYQIKGGTVSALIGSAIRHDGAAIIDSITGGRIETLGINGGGAGPTIFAPNTTVGSLNLTNCTVINTGGNKAVCYSNNPPGINLRIKNSLVFAYGSAIFSDDSSNYAALYGKVLDIATNEPDLGVICVWNKAAGRTEYRAGTSIDLRIYPENATISWGKNGSQNGIVYKCGSNTGFIPISGVTVDSQLTYNKMKNFKIELWYIPLKFPDVNEDAWYGYNKQKVISTAYEYGLMQGSGKGFNPTGNMTIREALAIASRVHNIYNDGTGVFTQGSPWYQVYVDYAIANNIINAGDFSDTSRAATRAEMAYIFSNALPASEFGAQNTVNSVSDVTNSTPYRNAILALYKAGVVEGSGAQHLFNPNNNVTRAEAAAIIARVILPETRFSGKTYG